ncbi:hypothetical protein SXCC_02478 [Gluconacetobacter sp. SXCC-1]|nr:hypothetical protein SXCC_02478 [Gluconacetobacter sp. SXCC-1]
MRAIIRVFRAFPQPQVVNTLGTLNIYYQFFDYNARILSVSSTGEPERHPPGVMPARFWT